MTFDSEEDKKIFLELASAAQIPVAAAHRVATFIDKVIAAKVEPPKPTQITQPLPTQEFVGVAG